MEGSRINLQSADRLRDDDYIFGKSGISPLSPCLPPKFTHSLSLLSERAKETTHTQSFGLDDVNPITKPASFSPKIHIKKRSKTTLSTTSLGGFGCQKVFGSKIPNPKQKYLFLPLLLLLLFPSSRNPNVEVKERGWGKKGQMTVGGLYIMYCISGQSCAHGFTWGGFVLIPWSFG